MPLLVAEPGAFEIRDVDLGGRIGRLYTRRGYIETPAFFPVIDVERQEVPIELVRDAGFVQVITNAYLILKRYGWVAAERGVHGILGFDGVVMTDSGAYQILEYGRIEVDQETIIRFQQAIGSDIAVILDVPTGDVDRARAEESVRITLQRAIDAIDLIRDDRERIWVLPVQGGRYYDLVEFSAKEASKLSGYYSMFGIGSPTVFLERYMYDVVVEAVYRAKRHLPPGRPVHLFGAGHPLIIPFVVALGVDTFDSASYILYARDGRYITEWGVYRLEDLDYLPCNCPVCSKYTPQDLKEMEKAEATRLLALHNLYVISRTIRRVKQAIREGRLWEVLEETGRMHPSTAKLLRLTARYRGLIEPGARRGGGRIKGVRAYGIESLDNPRLYSFRERSLEVLLESLKKLKPNELVMKPMTVKKEPSECEKEAVTSGSDVMVAFYTPYTGIFPLELCGVYPSIQTDYPSIKEPLEVVGRLVEEIVELVKHASLLGVKVSLWVCENAEWSIIAALRAYSILTLEDGLEVEVEFKC